jgi:hypothetical protein
MKSEIGGERGIRTLEGLLTLTPLAGVRLRPLGHLSRGLDWLQAASGACLWGSRGMILRGRPLVKAKGRKGHSEP